MTIDAPIDHNELCARVRFRHDVLTKMPDDEVIGRERYTADRIAILQSMGVRVTPTLTPGIHAKLTDVCRRLLLSDPLRLYIEADPEVNASAMHGGKHCVMSLTSGLANLLTLDEIGGVIGHELGHIGLQHAHQRVEGGMARIFVLESARAAEVSCDRLSIIAAGKCRTAVSAMLKICSGLNAHHLTLDVDAFLTQLAERPAEADMEWEAMQDHPVLPFRVWAMTRFAATDLCIALLGGEGGEPFEKVEDEISTRFKTIGAGLVARAVTDHLHEALAWLGVLIVCEDGSESEIEISTLTTLTGSIWAEDAIEYMKLHGAQAVKSRAKDSLRALSMAHPSVKDRVRLHSTRFIESLNAHAMKVQIDALIDEAWRR